LLRSFFIILNPYVLKKNTIFAPIKLFSNQK